MFESSMLKSKVIITHVLVLQQQQLVMEYTLHVMLHTQLNTPTQSQMQMERSTCTLHEFLLENLQKVTAA